MGGAGCIQGHGGWDSGGVRVSEEHRGGPQLTPPHPPTPRCWCEQWEGRSLPTRGQGWGGSGGAYGAEMGIPAAGLSLGGR